MNTHTTNHSKSIWKKKGINSALMIILAAMTIHLTGCSNEALFLLPARTKQTFSFTPGAGIVFWYSAGNRPERHVLTETEAKAGSVTVEVREGIVTPLLLYRKGDIMSVPAGDTEAEGCIWPVSTRLDKAGGFSAYILWQLLSETDIASPETIRDFCNRFNWKRFFEETRKKADPWKLDQKKILDAVSSGSFTVKDLSR